MREIIYRGQRVKDKQWVQGMLTRDVKGHYRIQYDPHYFSVVVIPETVGQYTGLKDKNGKMIFDGDVIMYYSYKRYVQQTYDECRPEIDELTIKKSIDEIIFEDGCFITRSNSGLLFIDQLSTLGLSDVEEVKDDIFGENRKDYYDEEDMECDLNGVKINDSIIGIEVIGNIHDNPELINKK